MPPAHNARLSLLVIPATLFPSVLGTEMEVGVWAIGLVITNHHGAVVQGEGGAGGWPAAIS